MALISFLQIEVAELTRELQIYNQDDNKRMTYGVVYFMSQREGAKSRRSYTLYEIVALKCGLSLLMDLNIRSIHTHIKH